ncbi:TPA: fimbria/pilus outer membrane usher protein, partial [Escherichia coli]
LIIHFPKQRRKKKKKGGVTRLKYSKNLSEASINITGKYFSGDYVDLGDALLYSESKDKKEHEISVSVNNSLNTFGLFDLSLSQIRYRNSKRELYSTVSYGKTLWGGHRYR